MDIAPGLVLGFVLAGILFGIETLISYGLMDMGVLPAAIDIFMQRRKII